MVISFIKKSLSDNTILKVHLKTIRLKTIQRKR